MSKASSYYSLKNCICYCPEMMSRVDYIKWISLIATPWAIILQLWHLLQNPITSVVALSWFKGMVPFCKKIFIIPLRIPILLRKRQITTLWRLIKQILDRVSLNPQSPLTGSFRKLFSSLSRFQDLMAFNISPIR